MQLIFHFLALAYSRPVGGEKQRLGQRRATSCERLRAREIRLRAERMDQDQGFCWPIARLQPAISYRLANYRVVAFECYSFDLQTSKPAATSARLFSRVVALSPYSISLHVKRPEFNVSHSARPTLDSHFAKTTCLDGFGRRVREGAGNCDSESKTKD